MRGLPTTTEAFGVLLSKLQPHFRSQGAFLDLPIGAPALAPFIQYSINYVRIQHFIIK